MAVPCEQKQTLIYLANAHHLFPVPHLHKEIELIYVHEGSGRAVAIRNTCELRKGDVYLAFPYQVHYYPSSQTGRYSILAFPASILLTLEETFNTNELVNKPLPITPGSEEAQFLEHIINAKGE